MNKFSFKRFVAYSKSELASNRRMLLLLPVAVIAYIFILFYLNHLAQQEGSEGSNVIELYSLNTPNILSCVSISIFCVVYASMAFKKYFHKGYAGASLMLPVAQSEKFAFALLFNTIVVPIVLVGMALTISYGWASWALDLNWTFFDVRTLFDIAIGMQIYISLFFLGAIVFRRHQILYTLLSLFAINMVFGYALYLLAGFIEWWNPDLIWFRDACRNFFSGWTSEKALFALRSLGETIGLLFILFIWWLSWIRFRKLQITK